MKLTNDDVVEILRLLEVSSFDELRLESGDLKLLVSRVGAGSRLSRDPQSDVSAPVTSRSASSVAIEPAPGRNNDDRPDTLKSIELYEVRAPMLGTFYSRPKPEAQPFVSIGTEVDAGSTVCIIEVMKLMNSISAGQSGEVVEICAADGALVEFGQLLMRIAPPCRND